MYATQHIIYIYNSLCFHVFGYLPSGLMPLGYPMILSPSLTCGRVTIIYTTIEESNDLDYYLAE